MYGLMLVTIDSDALGYVTGGATISSSMMLLMAAICMQRKLPGFGLDGDSKSKLFDMFKGMIEKKAAKPAEDANATK